MRLMLDTSEGHVHGDQAPEPRKDFGKEVQKMDRDTGRAE